MTSVVERVNLSYLNAINSNMKEGDDTSLVINFDYPRMLSRQSNVGGCFAYSCFAGDVFSQRAYFIKNMSKNAIVDMTSKKPEEYNLYDPRQKGFNKSEAQESWYGIDLTRSSMNTISINEGLEGYKAIRWMSEVLQQKDFDFINECLVNKKSIVQIIRDSSRWDVFWNTVVTPTAKSSSQKSLFEF